MYQLKIKGEAMGYVTVAASHIRNDATPPIEAKEICTTVPSLLISHLAVKWKSKKRPNCLHYADRKISNVAAQPDVKYGRKYFRYRMN